MKLDPVESSHIAAIGYLEDERVLLVRYRDGSLYAQPKVGRLFWVGLELADSKGQYLKDTVFVAQAVLISKEVMPEAKNENIAAEGAARESAPLNYIGKGINGCCHADIAAALESDAIRNYVRDGGRQLKCRKCGALFAGEWLDAAMTMLRWEFTGTFDTVTDTPINSAQMLWSDGRGNISNHETLTCDMPITAEQMRKVKAVKPVQDCSFGVVK